MIKERIEDIKKKQQKNLAYASNLGIWKKYRDSRLVAVF